MARVNNVKKSEGDDTDGEVKSAGETAKKAPAKKEKKADPSDDRKQEERLLEAAMVGPVIEAKAAGKLGDVAEKMVQLSTVVRALTGKMKVAGFNVADIFSVLAMIGMFFVQHEGDIDAIWDKILELFPKYAPQT